MNSSWALLGRFRSVGKSAAQDLQLHTHAAPYVYTCNLNDRVDRVAYSGLEGQWQQWSCLHYL